MRGFYNKLALSNVKRSKEVYLPYYFATLIMSGVYFLIVSMINNPGLSNVPDGDDAKAIFMVGTAVFTLFIFFFMLYINAFLIRRRKREFGLYSVLGMSKADVARVLRRETLIVVGAGVLSGFLVGAVLGRLLFMLLLTMMNATVSGSVFILPPIGFLVTVGLFLSFFLAASIYNSVHIHTTNTAELLKSDKKGEKDSKLLIPAAIVGLLFLGGSYFAAHQLSFLERPVMAMGFFFPLVFVVILATFLLFHAGSIALLRALRRNKRFYYRAENFVSVAGMFHRMRQNARGLASICIFSTMLMVTVACTVSLYLGQEDILRALYPYDVTFNIMGDSSSYSEEDLAFIDRTIARYESQYGVAASAAEDDRIIFHAGNLAYGREAYAGKNLVNTNNGPLIQRESYLYHNGFVFLDLTGNDDTGLHFSIDVLNSLRERYEETYVNEVFSARTGNYTLYGGLLFLGVFFAVLFMAMTALMIYFKQITEGYEDREGFTIMQKVGMQDTEVRRTINRQILIVFLLPIIAAFIHMLAASRLISKMLEAFALYNAPLTYLCIAATAALFAIVYLFVYKRTAKTYFRIVRRRVDGNGNA